METPPAALKAIVVVHASDDRHADDMHYMGAYKFTNNGGGLVLFLGGFEWVLWFYSRGEKLNYFW